MSGNRLRYSGWDENFLGTVVLAKYTRIFGLGEN